MHQFGYYQEEIGNDSFKYILSLREKQLSIVITLALLRVIIAHKCLSWIQSRLHRQLLD